MSAQPKEAVGAAYSIESMRYAQAMTWQAIEQLAQRIRPGMLESEARELGKHVLADLDMQRIWHPLLVRFGANTLKTFKQRSEGDPILGDNDIFFIDMGVVWQGHEGGCRRNIHLRFRSANDRLCGGGQGSGGPLWQPRTPGGGEVCRFHRREG